MNGKMNTRSCRELDVNNGGQIRDEWVRCAKDERNEMIKGDVPRMREMRWLREMCQGREN